MNPTTGTSGTGGTDIWLYTPSGTPGVASGFGTSAAGTYARLGLFATPTATALGNITPSTNFRNSNLYFLSNAGTAAGNSNRVDASGNFEGLAAWYYNGTTNVDISPALSGVHNAVAGGAVYSSNTITALNSNAGLVAGYATRIAGTTTGSAALGQDAYIYDASNGQTIFVDPNDANMGTGNYELSYVGVIGDDGTAIGYYNTYSGTSSTVLSSTLFAWTESTSLQPLVTYTGSTAASSMAAFVDSFQIGGNGTIYGPNTYGSSATSDVAYDVAAVPEPASIWLLGVGVLPALWRRRSRA